MTSYPITARLEDLIDRLDARIYVTIFLGTTTAAIFNGKVYDLLPDDNPIIKEHGQRKVTGLVITCGYVNILLGEE